MSHMVVYRTVEGKPAYHQADALEEAVRFVEHLRNSENVGEARIFRMHELAIEFKTYYRVQISEGEARSRPAPEPVAAPPAAPVVSSAPVAPAPRLEVQEPATLPSGNGRFGLFGKG